MRLCGYDAGVAMTAFLFVIHETWSRMADSIHENPQQFASVCTLIAATVLSASIVTMAVAVGGWGKK